MQWEVEPTGARIAQLATDLTARIDALDPESDTPVYSDFTFSIAVADWTLANGVYTARVNNTVLLTENAGIQVFYDASLRTGLTGDIFADKHTGYIDFTTTLQPVGKISGIIRVLDSVSGMLSVAKGGTGAATPKRARENLNTPIRDIPVNFGTVSSLPQTVYDADLTANMIAFDAVFSNPAAVPDGIDVTFAAGSVTISGTIASNEETSIKFWCHEQRTSVEGTESGATEPRVNEFVHVGAQTLTADQQAQIRTNLGAASASDLTALNSNFIGSISSIGDLNSVISGMVSGERRVLLFGGDVTNFLINSNAASIATVAKMDSSGVTDMFLYSLGGNYAGEVRYSSASSSVLKENRAILNNDIVAETVTSGTIEIAANDRGVFSIDVSKSGYTPIGIIGLNLSNNWMYVGGFSITGTNAQVVIHNGMNRSTANETVYLTVLYKRT